MDYEIKKPLKELEDELMHYGVKRRSGRYEWGSGDNPYQHEGDFLSRVIQLRQENFEFIDKDGKKLTGDNAIAKSMGLNTTQFRTQLGIAKDERRSYLVDTAKSLRKRGMSYDQIAKEMGFNNDSSVRSLLNAKAESRMKQAKETAEFLKSRVDKVGMVDVGAGVAQDLHISNEKLNQALYILEMEGYNTFGGRVPQPTNPKQQTTLRVLCPPDTPYKMDPETGKKTSSAIYQYDKINSVNEYITRDNGKTYEKKFNYPKSMDSKRLAIRYAEDGGKEKDGVIELRRGVPDLDLQGDHYAQVRILVDNNRYLKGMAVYSDNMPDGVDVIFNTNKTKNVDKMDVLKKIKDDPDNPFGASIKDFDQGGQYKYTDKNGKEQLGLLNKARGEGDWNKWKDKLPSQFLSKQSTALAKRQLGLEVASKQSELDEIRSLTNPTVRKKLLQDFADNCDYAAVHLQGAALPRQKYHVIMPIPSLKDNEVYAPNYTNGEKVALIRYPHGGLFEIPILTVNNKHKESRKVLGTDARDVVGINSSIAERLSGADFDGDTVMVIPTNDKIRIKNKPPLEGLKDFDPKTDYATTNKNGKLYNAEGHAVNAMNNTQTEMGIISNLITDMTIQGATDDELEKAVKHSMVVIDAEKHELDYQSSYKDNNISYLKKKYQPDGGASTLISKAKNEYSVPKRQGSPKVNMKGSPDYDPSRPEGALIYKTADDLYYEVTKTNKRTGEKKTTKVMRTEPSTQMAETDDARTLISKLDTPMERLYADYANKMKAMANQARKEMMLTKKIPYSSKAKDVYRDEFDSLKRKLNESLQNKPRERLATTMAASIIAAKKQDNPGLKGKELQKVSQQAIASAREKVGAKRTLIEVTDKEWEAIQAGAISESALNRILNNADMSIIKEKAMPRTTTTLTDAKISRINSMRASGLTIKQIADALGISTSTVSKHLN